MCQITRAFFLDQPIKSEKFRSLVFLKVFSQKSGTLWDLIFGRTGLVVWCMGRMGLAVGRVDQGRLWFKWASAVWLNLTNYNPLYHLLN